MSISTRAHKARRFAALATTVSLAYSARPAIAEVLKIGDDGVVRRHTAPALYTTRDLRPDWIAKAPHRQGQVQVRSTRLSPPSPMIARTLTAAAYRFGVNPRLVEAVAWRESGFRTDALSARGAVGVMQLMPSTATRLGVDAREPTSNIHGGVAYLGWLLRRYNGDLTRSLAAYNAGPTAVDRYGGLPPYAETRAFVGAILDRMSQPTPSAAAPPAQESTQEKPVKISTARLVPAAVAALAVLPTASPASAQVSGDPAGSGPILGALQWIQGTLLGTLATTAAVIAVAVVGLMMLTGRIEWRRGLTVVLGAFIVFGAVAIVAGMRSIAMGAN